jgi:sugar phosphate isomerase/epimerase
MMQLSYSTWGMPTVPIEIAVAHCAAVGFDGLELTVLPGWPTDAATLDRSARQRIRRLYDDHDLELAGLFGSTSLLAADADQVAANLDRFRGYLDLASELQRPGETLTVSTSSGGRPGDWEDVKWVLAERYASLAEHAARAGVVATAEPHVRTALHRPEQARWLVRQVGSPSLRVHFDISHFNVQGMDMEEVIGQLVELSVHTHVKDERGIVPDFAFLMPGEGDMDYVRYLRAMDAAGYRGHITVEMSVMVQRRPGYDPLAAATRSYEVLSSAFDVAGLRRPGHSEAVQ